MELVMEQEAPAGEVCLTPEAMDAYLDTLRQQGRSADTLAAYRRSIYGLYRSLPPDKRVGRGTLDRWRETLEDQGYLPRTINVRLAAANGLMTYLGHRELQATAALPPPAEVERPELTRGEYLRLLSTARVLEKERLYLLVKVFGSTGLSVGELPRLTAEALDGRGPSPVRLPPPLAEELRGYAARQGITAGPVFRSRNGQPIRRTQVTGEIRSLCRDARVPEEKGNPRCLRRLWQETQDAIRVSVDQLVVQAFDQMMEAEQFSVGWDAGKGVGMMGPHPPALDCAGMNISY